MKSLTTIRLLPVFLATMGFATVIGFTVFAAVVGLSVAVYWTYVHLSPIVVIGVMFGSFWLLGRAINRIPDPPNRDWRQ